MQGDSWAACFCSICCLIRCRNTRYRVSRQTVGLSDGNKTSGLHLQCVELQSLIVIPADTRPCLCHPFLLTCSSTIMFYSPSIRAHCTIPSDSIETVSRQVNSCDVKFFTGSKMSLEQECCERCSCCGNCKAVLEAATILYFHPPVLPASTSNPPHLSRLGEEMLDILILTSSRVPPPPLGPP